MSVEGQSWEIQRGQDAAFIALGDDTTNPSAWALLFSLFPYPGATVPTYSTPTVTVSGPDANGIYSLTISLTRSQTIVSGLLTGPTYYGGVWRTDTGASVPLFGLTLTIRPASRRTDA
jgi:hypothetical protein